MRRLLALAFARAAALPVALGLAWAAVLPVALGLAWPAAADPRVDYMLQCQGCHLPDGSGTPGAVPPLRGSLGRFLRVPGGREFLVRVPGSAQSPLDDARLAAVLNWILERFDPDALGPDFVPFSAEEVARLRHPPLLDVEGLRRELLARRPTEPARASDAGARD